MTISLRCQQLNVSGIRKVFDLASSMKNPVNLSIGQPDFDIPSVVKEAAIREIQAGNNRYTPSAGIQQLRDKIQSSLNERGLITESVMLTSGVSGGLLLSLMALLNPGDEVLVPDPYFVMYDQLPPLIGAKVIKIDTYPDFRLDPEKLKEVITPKTKILFLNNPSNPTGRILNEKRMKEIAEILRGTPVWVISDEIYEAFDYENQLVSFGKYHEKTLTLNGFSKSAGMPGWRMGYAAGPKMIIDAMINLQQYTFVCAPSFAQHACLTAWDISTDHIRDAYRKKRNLVMEALSPFYDIQKPDGAFYFFMKHHSMNGDDLVMNALKKEVLLVPGSVFSQKNTHFRLSFANSDSELKRGIERLREIGK
ncbi:MAG: aminotransferase class I/II-fold pyridoxal phosphate-dependent enzyme [Candidatus Aureabacteria bacterium]|nr:aminotransferase class I/II-fold pyridoxal phosphate-dependent enzyme [Candidatus Auribacterota bacterium]